MKPIEKKKKKKKKSRQERSKGISFSDSSSSSCDSKTLLLEKHGKGNKILLPITFTSNRLSLYLVNIHNGMGANPQTISPPFSPTDFGSFYPLFSSDFNKTLTSITFDKVPGSKTKVQMKLVTNILPNRVDITCVSSNSTFLLLNVPNSGLSFIIDTAMSTGNIDDYFSSGGQIFIGIQWK